MVRRAGGCSQAQDLVLEEVDHAVMRQERRRSLIEECLVRRTAALGNEKELVGVFAFFIDIDLGRQIVLGVLFLEHRKRRQLRITQVLLVVGVEHTSAKRIGITAFGPDATALLAHDDGRAGILTHGKHAACCDIGVLQKIVGDKTVVIRCFRVFKNMGKLLQMAGAQQMVDIGKGRFRK